MRTKDLAPNPQNPRKATDAKIEQLKAAMLEFGDLSGIVFNRKSGQLVGGHQRTKNIPAEAKVRVTKTYAKPTRTGTVAEGYVELDGERFTYREVSWERTREIAANIAANKGAGEWDLPQLGEWMKELSSFDNDFDMSLTMFDEDELEEFGGIIVSAHTRVGPGGTDEDDVPEKPPARTKLGDVYRLGDHRLMCGDSTDERAVAKLMKGSKADLVFTDPPYRMEAEGGLSQPIGRAAAKLGDRIKHLCDFDPVAFLKVLAGVFDGSRMNAYVFCNKDLVPDYLRWAVEAGYSFNILVWKKPNAIPLGGQHRPDMEYLLFFRRSAIWNNALEGVSYSKCLEFGRETGKDHPTMKPVGLIENELLISSNSSSVVLDLFGGSGSTMIAAEKTNRHARLMELDPGYCDVIVDRWEKYTGRKAKLVATAKDPKPILKRAAKQADKHANG